MPVTCYVLATWQAHAKGRRTLSCPHQRPMPADPYPDTPPHTTQSGIGYTDKLFTSYHNLGPSLPWEGGGPGGRAQHAPPLLWGLISPPARLGPGATASGLWGRRWRWESRGPVEPQRGRQKQGTRGQGQGPGLLGPRGPCRPRPVLWARPHSRRQALPTLSAEVSRSWL